VHVPGEFVDLHALMLKVMDHSVVAIGPCEAAFIAHASLIALVESAPHLVGLFRLSTAIDAAIQRSWITNLGRRSPSEQVAHLVCEFYSLTRSLRSNCFNRRSNIARSWHERRWRSQSQCFR
jgi:CRP-like cAMP-binding protein